MIPLKVYALRLGWQRQSWKKPRKWGEAVSILGNFNPGKLSHAVNRS